MGVYGESGAGDGRGRRHVHGDVDGHGEHDGLEHGGLLGAVCDVGGDDVRDDDTVGRADDSGVCDGEPAEAGELGPYVPTFVFLLGYLVLWAAFSAVAATAQWGLHQGALLSSMMGSSTSAILGGSLLLAAGIFQWTPLKYACLKGCRSPLGFLMNDWRDGYGGALVMGIRHGAFCVACCWVLMGCCS